MNVKVREQNGPLPTHGLALIEMMYGATAQCVKSIICGMTRNSGTARNKEKRQGKRFVPGILARSKRMQLVVLLIREHEVKGGDLYDS